MKPGTELESYVKYVYETMLNLKGENIIVSKNAIISGNSGAKHEVDVFYQFEKANIIHKVALECKDTTTAVPKGKVQEFFGKIEDINNLIGIMVSKNGYQSGAITYAKAKGILLLNSSDLPNIPDLLSQQISKFFLPESCDIGEPFWAIMEIDDDNQVNGNYYLMPNLDGHEKGIALFMCKIEAEIHLNNLPDKHRWNVRGLRQYHLKGIVSWSKIHKNYFYIVLSIAVPNQKGYMVRKVKSNILEKEYLIS